MIHTIEGTWCRVSLPGCPAKTSSRLDPAAELILRDRGRNDGDRSHTVREASRVQDVEFRGHYTN
jgi:hypothetical protein